MNVVNSIVGVSVLTMPFCFKQCGIVLGTLLLFFCSWMTHQSCMFLVHTASNTKRRTYAGLAFHAFGKPGKAVVELSMIGLMLGTCIAFYVVIADLGSNFFARLIGLQVSGSFRILLLIAVSLFIVLPLSLQRNLMSSIQSFSAMALIFYTLFMFTIVLSSLRYGIISGSWVERVHLWRIKGVVQCLPIIATTFCCHPQVLPTYDSLDEPSVKRMSTIFTSSLNVVTAFYITVGFFGYVSFTDTIAGNVLMNFPSNLVTEMIRVGFMMSIAVSFPMMILPCRQAINTMLFEQQQKDGTFAAGGYMPPIRFKGITLCIVFGTMLGGILIPNVETILGLTGATMGSLICFICPALIYKKIMKNSIVAQLVLFVGLGILLLSTVTTLSTSTEVKQQEPSGDLAKTNDKSPDFVVPELPKHPADESPVAPFPAGEPVKSKLAVEQILPAGENLAPVNKDPVEPPQIKVPVAVPDHKKNEEVQLNRPEAEVARPDEEAHRHEPPIPHDEVLIEGHKNQQERNEENKKPVGEVEDDLAEQGAGHMQAVVEEGAPKKLDLNQDLANKAHEKIIEQNKLEQVVVVKKDLDQAVLEKEEQSENKPKVDKKLDGVNNAVAEKQPEPLPVAEGQDGAQEHKDEKKQDVNDPKDEEGDKMEEGVLDHAVLLQVIKEQQEQQKRLLDQQEKLLAVIEEQHKEIHQKKEGEEEPKADGVAEVGKEVQQNEEGKVKAPEHDSEHKHVQENVPEQRNAIDGQGNAIHLDLAKDKELVNPKQEKQPPQAVHIDAAGVAEPRDGDSLKELGAKGVPLHIHQPESLNLQNQDGQKNVEQLLPEDLAKEELEVKQRLAQLELEKEKLEKEKQEKLAHELQHAHNEIKLSENEKPVPELPNKQKEISNHLIEKEEVHNMQEQKENSIQLQHVINKPDANQNKIEVNEDDTPERLKKGGRDLKENIASPEREVPNKPDRKDEGEIDLKRRRRALGPEDQGVPGLESLLELGGSDLHAALEGQLLAGAVVYSRQIKQTQNDQTEEKSH